MSLLDLIPFVRIVPQGYESIVVMFGKPVRKCKSGINFRIPIIQRFYDVGEGRGWKPNETRHENDGTLIEVTEQMTDLRERPFITADGVNVFVDIVSYWRINDVMKAVFSVDQLHRSLYEKILTEVRTLVGERTLEQLLKDRSRLSDGVVTKIAGEVSKWGITMTSVDIQKIQMDKAVEAALLQEMEADRKARAIALEAQGKATAMKLDAEAQREALLIKAAAQKDYLNELAGIVGSEGALKIMLSQQVLDGYKSICETESSKVYLPSNMMSILNINN